MGNRAVIGVIGVRAAGKTTVIEKIKSTHLDIQTITVGEEIKTYSLRATGKGFFEHDFACRDRIRIELGKILASRIQKSEGKFLLDMHLSDYREGLDKVIQPSELLQMIDGFVFLDAFNETILGRRVENEKRGRSLSEKDLMVERTGEWLAVTRVIQTYGSLFWHISTEISLEATCQKILEIFDSISRRKRERQRCPQDSV